MKSFYLTNEHHALFAICSMVPECGEAPVPGTFGWLPVAPVPEAMRRAHKIACQKRYKTTRAALRATRRFRRAFPELWAVAVEHVRRLGE